MRAFTLTVSRDVDFMHGVKYKNFREAEKSFDGDEFQGLEGPTPCRDEIIPDPDSIPLSVLYHPTTERYKINLAAYDPPEPVLPHVEGTHPL